MISIVQKKLIDDFGQLFSWEEKYEHLIFLGKKLQTLEEKEKIAKNLVPACSSRSWIVINEIEGKFYFKAESDSMIVQGLLYILIEIYSGLKRSEILEIEPVFITKIGFDNFLSVNRRRGLYGVLEKIKNV